jgi:hypothetical protein
MHSKLPIRASGCGAGPKLGGRIAMFAATRVTARQKDSHGASRRPSSSPVGTSIRSFNLRLCQQSSPKMPQRTGKII